MRFTDVFQASTQVEKRSTLYYIVCADTAHVSSMIFYFLKLQEKPDSLVFSLTEFYSDCFIYIYLGPELRFFFSFF